MPYATKEHFSIGEDDLEKLPVAEEQAQCPHCLGVHPIIWSNDALGHPTRVLGVVRCEEKLWLVAVAGRLLTPKGAVTA